MSDPLAPRTRRELQFAAGQDTRPENNEDEIEAADWRAVEDEGGEEDDDKGDDAANGFTQLRHANQLTRQSSEDRAHLRSFGAHVTTRW